jgi:hypothetical protein
MHFQTPPHDHAKLVTVIQGTIVDVILDIRRDSPTYGQHVQIELSRENRRSIYIAKGLAHGFGTLSDSAIAYYMVTSEYAPEHDKIFTFLPRPITSLTVERPPIAFDQLSHPAIANNHSDNLFLNVLCRSSRPAMIFCAIPFSTRLSPPSFIRDTLMILPFRANSG